MRSMLSTDGISIISGLRQIAHKAARGRNNTLFRRVEERSLPYDPLAARLRSLQLAQALSRSSLSFR